MKPYLFILVLFAFAACKNTPTVSEENPVKEIAPTLKIQESVSPSKMAFTQAGADSIVASIEQQIASQSLNRKTLPVSKTGGAEVYAFADAQNNLVYLNSKEYTENGAIDLICYFENEALVYTFNKNYDFARTGDIIIPDSINVIAEELNYYSKGRLSKQSSSQAEATPKKRPLPLWYDLIKDIDALKAEF